MPEGNLEHIEFWTQFQQYLKERDVQIRLSKPSNSSSSSVLLSRSYFRLRPWRLLRNNRLGVWVQFNEPGATGPYERVEREHRRNVDDRLAPLGTIDWTLGKTSLARREATLTSETWEERNAWLANALETTLTLFNKILPPAPKLKLEIQGEKVVNSDSGEVYDLPAIAARLPWRPQKTGNSSWDDWPPYMPPHEYVVFGKCDYGDWDVLYFACMKHPASYWAYFRGYQSRMRYWELGDGYRYWPTAFRGVLMLNRCTLDSVEPPRRVDQGARPIKPKDWGAPPWLPQGNGWPCAYLKKHPKLAGELGMATDQEA